MNRAIGVGVVVCLGVLSAACFVEPMPTTVRPVQATYVSAPAPQPQPQPQQVYVGGGGGGQAVGGEAYVGAGGVGVGGGVYVTPSTASGACFNTCRYANDGECDDGRPGAHTGLCSYGSDCNDCGAAY